VAGADTTGSAPAISAHDNGVTIVALSQYGYTSDSYWNANGSPTWTPSPMPDGDTSASSIVAYPGLPGTPGGVHVVAREIFGYLGVSSSVGGTGTWTSTQVINTGLSQLQGVGGVPSITMNDGSVNIAVEGYPGDLWFYWQDSSGAFHQETVDTAANL
jgi:hypothetical protein